MKPGTILAVLLIIMISLIPVYSSISSGNVFTGIPLTNSVPTCGVGGFQIHPCTSNFVTSSTVLTNGNPVCGLGVGQTVQTCASLPAGTQTQYIWLLGGARSSISGNFLATNGIGGAIPGSWAGQVDGIGSIELPAAATPSAYFFTVLPDTWTGTITLRSLTELVIAATGTGTYVQYVSTFCATLGATDLRNVSLLAYNAAQTITDTIAVNNGVGHFDTITPLTTTGCASGQMLIVQILRKGGVGADNAPDNLGIAGVQLIVQHT
jgi:hypothetical protein